MQKILIHAGMPRTGTKSVQQSLMALDGEDYLYAPLSGIAGFPSHSRILRNLFTPPGDPQHAELVRNVGAAAFSASVKEAEIKLQEAFRLAGGRSLILSAEDLMKMSGKALRLMRNHFAHHTGQIRILGYVRAPLSFIESALQQRIRQGSADIDALASLWPRYQSSFQRLDTAFGAENVTLLKYDPDRFPNQDVVTDFCKHLGVPLSDIMVTRCNEGLTQTAAQLLYQYGQAAQAGHVKPLSLAQANALAERPETPGRDALPAFTCAARAVRRRPGERCRLDGGAVRGASHRTGLARTFEES